MMVNEKPNVFYDCFLCERKFQFGQYVYDGQYIPTWHQHLQHMSF